MLWTTKVLLTLTELLATNKQILKVLRLRQPGPMFLTVTQEIDSMLKFHIALPQPGASDVVARRLTVQIGEAEAVIYDLDGKALQSETLEGQDVDNVTASLVDIDDAGNESSPSTGSFVLVDTIAPPQPGVMGLVVTEEIDNPAPPVGPEAPTE